MCLVPERLIVALQEDGWFVRRDIVWHKEAAMPEAVQDRPTTAHEYVWLLSKRARYFYDWLAIAEETSPDTHARMGRAHNSYQAPGQDEQRGVAGFRENINNGLGQKSRIPSGWDTGAGNHHGKRGRYTPKQNASFQAATSGHVLMVRNSRSVWTINPEPFGLEMCVKCRTIYDTPEFRRLPKVALKPQGHTRRCRCGSKKWVSHFATFPTELVERCVRAGTSAKGVCPSCFAPWKRIVRKGASLEEWKQACGADAAGGYEGLATKDYAGAGAQDASAVKARILSGMRERVTVGWQPTCKCAPHEPVLNSSVLDPFGGSCTVGLVASRLQRNSVLIEINEYYCEMGRWRMVRDAPLLVDVEIRKEVVSDGQETQEAETEAGARAGAGVLSVEQEARE
jgi:DNA modification methylase